MSALCLQLVSRLPGGRKVSHVDELCVTVGVIKVSDLLRWYLSLLTLTTEFWERSIWLFGTENVQKLEPLIYCIEF